MEYKKISIVTVNLNNKDGLEKTIESVINQTFFDRVNYIIIDGGSTDGSVDVIDKYKGYLSYYVSEKDNGVYNAMNKGIDVCNSEYIQFLNSGDYFYANNVLEEIYEELDTDIVYGALNVHKSDGSTYIINGDYMLNKVLPHPSCFTKVEILKNHKFDENYKIISDWIFFFEEICGKHTPYKHLDTIVADFPLGGLSSDYNAAETERVLYLNTISDSINVKIAMCSIGRMENRYVVEFVEFYHKLGIEKFFIYDNNYDGEEHFEEVLQPYIDEGIVEIIDFRNKSVCQLKAYQDCYDRHGDEYDWICFFDFDEYLLTAKNISLKVLLDNKIYDGFDIIHVNELIYGDSGNVLYEDKPVVERFTSPVKPIDYRKTFRFPENCHVKSIVRGGIKNLEWKATPHTPSNKDLKCCNAIGVECEPNSPFVIPYVHKNIILRHYKTKSIEEFYETKVKRGYPDGNKDFFKKNSWVDDFFKENVRTPEKEAFIRSVMKIEKINVMIVNYNTPELIDSCVQSINKHVKNASIYVFDNSDKRPFINTFGNVTVIDNTKGQVINFEKWLNGYRIKNPMANNYGSAKHCYTIEKFMEMFDDNFVLMDSDVIVKKNFSDIYNDEYIFVGEKIGQYVMWGPRLLPYICFINNKMCKKLGVHFFDDKRMAQLNGDGTNDTGASFLQDASKYPHRIIKYNDYINHFAAGSWVKKNLEVKFLNPNKHLYEYDGEISIVIPCYNQGKYVSETIDSVKSMAYKDFCCIIVNDGSTDDSEKKILDSIKGDYRFRYFKTENKGVAHARNFGIKQTKSKYILCLDSDDIISKTYVKNAINFLNENDDVSLYYGDALLFYNDGYMKHWKLKEYSYRDLLKMNMIYSACIYRREIYDKIRGYDETLDGYEDWEFLIRYLNVNDNAYKTEELCFYYRRHENSRDHIVHEKIKDFAKLIFEKNKEIYEKNNLILNI